MYGLKRKGSTLSHTHRRSLGTTVDGFVLRPRNEDYLSDIKRCTRTVLHTAMAVSSDEFKQYTGWLRCLADELLDMGLPWEKQDADLRANFLTKVNDRHPIFREKFEAGWPVVVYTKRFLRNKCRKHGKRPHQGLPRRDLEHLRTGLNVQSYIAKPPDSDQLQDATEQDCRRAMDFDGTRFRSVQSLIQNLANKYLDTNMIYEDQDLRQRRLLYQAAFEAEPLLSTKYESAWPIEVFLKGHLRRRVRDASADLPSMTSGVQGLSSGPPRALSMATSTNNCVYRHPPIHSACSQFPWSPANFATSSSSTMRSPSVEASDAGENIVSLPHAPSSNRPLDGINHIAATSSKNKQNNPPAHASPSMPSDDPSAPVKKFLRGLNPNLEHLLPYFRDLGVENLETLQALKTWSDDEREELFTGCLNKMQILAVQNFIRKAD